MSDWVQDKLKTFYDDTGWQENAAGTTQDAQFFEDLRPTAHAYIRHCRRRLLPFLRAGGDKILDAASGPIQYPEYLEYSENFSKRVCVDISERALRGAAQKLGSRGDYVRGTLLELPFDDNSFDASVSLHTIYHIDKDEQPRAVRELLRVTRPGAPLLVVYSNPFPWHARVIHFFEKLFWERPRLLRAFRRLIGRDVQKLKSAASDEVQAAQALYFYPHPLEWWQQFRSEAQVEIFSWRFLTAEESQRWIPGNFLGRLAFLFVRVFEALCPQAAARWCAYPMILLRKK